MGCGCSSSGGKCRNILKKVSNNKIRLTTLVKWTKDEQLKTDLTQILAQANEILATPKVCPDSGAVNAMTNYVNNEYSKYYNSRNLKN